MDANFLQRLRRHSSSNVWYDTTKSFMFARLRISGLDPAIIADIEASSNYTDPVNVPSSLRPGDIIQPKPKSCWIKLPFHSVWRSEIDRALKQFCSEPANASDLSCLFGESMHSIRAAWTIKLPSLAHVVNRG